MTNPKLGVLFSSFFSSSVRTSIALTLIGAFTFKARGGVFVLGVVGGFFSLFLGGGGGWHARGEDMTLTQVI